MGRFSKRRQDLLDEVVGEFNQHLNGLALQTDVIVYETDVVVSLFQNSAIQKNANVS